MSERVTKEELKTLSELFKLSSRRYLGDRLPNLEARKIGELFVVFMVYPSRCGDYDIYSGDWEHHHETHLVSADLVNKCKVGTFSLKYTTEWPSNNSVQTVFDEDIQELRIDDKRLLINIHQRWFGKEPIVWIQGGTGVRSSSWQATRKPTKTGTRTGTLDIPDSFSDRGC